MKKIIMNSKSKILVGILVVGVVLIGGYFLLNMSKEAEIEFSIDSEEEAIAYAKTDPDVKEFIEIHSPIAEGYPEEYVSVEYKPNEDIWVIWFYGLKQKGTSYSITFNQYGVVSSKGEVFR